MKVISTYDSKQLNAGPKAKMDIENILHDKYNAEIITIPFNTNGSVFNKILNRLQKYIKCKQVERTDELVVIQFPFDGNVSYTKNIKNKIGIIHDIQELRYQKINNKEIDAIKECKYVISHNQDMTNYLISRGVNKNKIVNLEVFDYLTKNDISSVHNFDSKKVKIVYPGNLSLEKSPFLYQIDPLKINFTICAYGIGIDNSINEKIIYKGKFSPDNISNINGDLGLIWDGNFDESDENENFKNYTKYNNPHKFSCCLARGIPVIVWEKSAIAKLVKKYNLGYTIKNVYDINDLDFSNYEEYKQNAFEFGKKIRSGFFTVNAMERIIGELDEKKNKN